MDEEAVTQAKVTYCKETVAEEKKTKKPEELWPYKVPNRYDDCHRRELLLKMDLKEGMYVILKPCL